MKKFLVLIIIVIVGCTDEPLVFHVNSELQPYVDSFYREAELRGKSFPKNNLIVELSDLPDRVRGRSIRETGSRYNQITILIDEDFFNESDFDCIESVVFHEFGHAFLNRDHNNTYSVMNDYVCYSCWNRNEVTRKKLIDELFN